MDDTRNKTLGKLVRQARFTAAVLLVMVGLVFHRAPASGAAARPIDVIEDNSFLIEEAYNQERGVVQHIFNAIYNADSRTRGWTFSFTQEWPVFTQDHQFSYTIPSYHLRDGGQRVSGVGDILLNYRYQLLEEDDRKPAIAPRFSLILPTGSRSKGTGDNVVGYQWNLPLSKKLTERIATHVNFGLTYQPHVRAVLDSSTGQLSPKRSLVSFNLGASGIYALAPRLHLMLEWVGTFEDDINERGKRERNFLPLLSPGLRAAVVNQEKLQIVVGAAAPVGLNHHASNYGALLYLSIEHNFF
jgi:hypothetical protein